ncbi:MAG: hypothetical protein JW783_00740 [Bacteroidales bacterium]|nr:hypothetical protein [Bacteroidales bacterium]MBN2749638.1 hypothetical protein [Bacteroidales bacterium]
MPIRRLLLVLTWLLGFAYWTSVVSCTKNLEPMADSVFVSTSISVPLGYGVFAVDGNLVPIGIPEINLAEDVPNWAKHKVVRVTDSVAFSIGALYDRVDTIRQIVFKVNVWNQFPASAQVQVSFHQSGGALIDRLWLDNPFAIGASQVNSQGELFREAFSQSEVPMGGNRVYALRSVSYCLFTSHIFLEGVDPLLLNKFGEYTLTCQIAARADVDVLLGAND